MKIFRLGFILTCLALAACAPNYKRAPVTAQHMTCTGNAPASVTLYSPTDAKLSFGDKVYELNRIETASGIQYGNGDITFWNTGIDARIIRHDGTVADCTYVPQSGL